MTTYSYVSSDLNGIVSKTLPQPSVENNNQQCTAMMMQHPLYWHNWVKIPCNSNIQFSSFICEKPATDVIVKYTRYHVFQTERINNPNGIRCANSWILFKNRCVMVLNFNSTSEKDLEDVCSLANSKVSTMTPEEALACIKLLKGFWSHDIGNIYYKDDNILKVVSNNKSNDYIICEKDPMKWENVSHQHNGNRSLFWCGGLDQYWISIDYICDSKKDCLESNDDEKGCGEYKNKELYFQCDTERTKFISWNRFCDFRSDCPNKEDELNCVYPSCREIKDWRCLNEQCIDIQKRCDQVIDCLDGSDEKECDSAMCNGFNCSSSVCLPRKYLHDDIVDCPGVLMEDEALSQTDHAQNFKKERCFENAQNIMSLCSANSNKCMERNSTCIYRRDNMGSRDVCPLMDHLQNCDKFQCPGFFQCSKMRYCIDIQYVCDGVKDCPNGEDEDEDGCRNFTCPLYFRCRTYDKKRLVCIERKHLCNGVKECSNGEDEKYCDYEECPKNCRCSGFEMICNNTSYNIIFNIKRSARTITIRNTLDLFLSWNIFINITYLGYLDLSNNSIRTLPTHLFEGLYNLIILNLRSNKIKVLPSFIFYPLQNLKEIDLSKNPIHILEAFSLTGLVSLINISLTSMYYTEIPDNMFFGMSSKLLGINMSHNDISIINKQAFDGVTNLSWLDITVTKGDISIIGQPFSHITVGRVQTNIYKICCSLARFDYCSANTDISSNCDNLLANNSIRVIVWIIGVSGLLGNVIVIFGRFFSLKRNKDISNEEMLVINLAISDMFLGIYLVIIGITDKYYRNEYVENSILWKSGYVCTIAGYLATVSNQVSVTFLGLITLDRLICIVLISWKEYVRFIKYAIIPVWIIWTMSVGLFEYNRHVRKESFQSNGLCLSYFSLDYQSNMKNLFSLALIIYILIFLLLIVFSYILIFVHSCRTRRSAGRMLMLNDYQSAKKMLMLVMVFCLCWFPIIILSFVTKNENQKLTNDQLTWLTVVLMPLNSCLNPYLYTFSSVELCFKFNKCQNRPKKPNAYFIGSTISSKK